MGLNGMSGRVRLPVAALIVSLSVAGLSACMNSSAAGTTQRLCDVPRSAAAKYTLSGNLHAIGSLPSPPGPSGGSQCSIYDGSDGAPVVQVVLTNVPTLANYRMRAKGYPAHRNPPKANGCHSYAIRDDAYAKSNVCVSSSHSATVFMLTRDADLMLRINSEDAKVSVSAIHALGERLARAWAAQKKARAGT